MTISPPQRKQSSDPKKVPQLLQDRVAQLARLFKIYDQETNSMKPLVLTPTQEKIFDAIVRRSHPRWHIMCCTQYGKSETVACAVLLRAILFPEKWAIVAPTFPKAMIIMRKIIDHLNDSPLFTQQLSADNSVDRLKKDRSKQRITFNSGGTIFIVSADTRNKAAAGEALMGMGCLNADALVELDTGIFSIKEVVEKKIRGKIRSFDRKTQTFEWKEIKDWFLNHRGQRKMLRININGESLTLTEDHPVYVIGKGFIPAREVRIGDELLADQKNDSVRNLPETLL